MYGHYRGTTFQFSGQMQNSGNLQSLLGCQLNVSVFDTTGVTLIGTLTVNITDAENGYFTLSYPDTSQWPVGKARMDAVIAFSDGTTVASDPEYFRILQSPLVG